MQIFYGKDEALVVNHVRSLYPQARFVTVQKDLSGSLSDACSGSLFGQAGPCALTNCGFLTSGSLTAAEKEGLAGLKDLDDSQLIFVVSGDKLTVNEFINKHVISKAKTKKIAALTEKTAHLLVVDECRRNGITLKEEAMELFFSRLPLNWGIIASELQKITLLNKEEISANDLEELVSRYTDDTVFTWIETLLANDGTKAYALYLDLKNNGTDESELMGILAGQLALLKCAIIAYRKNPTVQGVANATNLPVFRIANNLHFIAKTSLKSINAMLRCVNQCDLMVKDGAISKEAALKVLIISAIGLGGYGRNN